jgi:hypothetical protein
MDEERRDVRAERRAQRQKAKREAMRKHGATTGEVYRNAVLKRMRATRRKRRP